jgi:hypothetical protein
MTDAGDVRKELADRSRPPLADPAGLAGRIGQASQHAPEKSPPQKKQRAAPQCGAARVVNRRAPWLP